MPTEYKKKERDRLFYDQYHYSLCFILPECGVLREPTEDKVLSIIQWRNHSRQSWSRGERIDVTTTANLLDMWRRLKTYEDQIKYTCSFNRVYVYSNNVPLLESIANQPYARASYGQQAVVTRPRDVILKRDPKFKLRTYFKDRSIEPEQQAMLLKFLEARQETYGYSTALRFHLNKNRWFYMQRHQWVEHNDPADLTMLSLVVPGLFRKTVPVQAK